MLSLRKLISSFILFAVVVAPLSLSYAAKTEAQELPGLDNIYSSISIRLDNIPRAELYAFMTDLTNEPDWYPGILSTTLLQEGNNGGLVGRKYEQVAFVTENLTTTTEIEVKAAIPNFYYRIKGTGDFASYDAIYTFYSVNGGQGTVYTLTSKYVAPGFTEETFGQYISFALGNLINYYSDRSTGSVDLHFVYIN